jgi:hypothetical protein
MANDNNLLPPEILQMKKVAFSDGVGMSWVDHIREFTSTLHVCNYDFDESDLSDLSNKHDLSDNHDLSDDHEEKNNSNSKYSKHIKPTGSTEKYFQYLFNEFFPNQWNILPHLWLPNKKWVDTKGESSARVLSVYNKS